MTDRPYPQHWVADAVLADGGTVHLRPVHGSDAELLRDFHARLSPSTIQALRDIGDGPWTRLLDSPDTLVDSLAGLDYDTRCAVVAVLREQIVGLAAYQRIAPGTAPEAAIAAADGTSRTGPAGDTAAGSAASPVADSAAGSADAIPTVVVADDQTGRGLGSLLLEHLAGAARERGVQRFITRVPLTNQRMLEMLRSIGYRIFPSVEGGRAVVSFPIEETELSRQIWTRREQRAEARSIARLLTPDTVAVIGASRQPGTPGHEVFRRLLAGDFPGPVYPVNPATSQVASVYAYPDIREVPGPVDLAVIAVPAEAVADVARACAEKQVQSLIVVSGGFAEAGEAGRARLAEVTRIARGSGMRLVGPNAMGVINTDPEVRLYATFAAGDPPPGRVGAFTQSGALAGTFLTEAARRSIGISTFVSTGDRSDVSGNDILQYWLTDERTDVIMMHLRGFGNPRKFVRIARRLGRRKPVVALKSGRGSADAAVDALFSSAGVVRVDTLGQLFDAAALLAFQPLPAGRRIGIVGTSSALAAMATDACRTVGLEVPAFSPQVAARLAEVLGPHEPANPVDLGALADPDRFADALRIVAGSGEVDAVLALVTPHPAVDRLAAAVRELAARGTLPVLASFLGHDGVPDALAVRDQHGAPGRGSVPSYASPESAAIALARAADYAAWRTRDQGSVPELKRLDLERSRRAAAAGPQDGSWLPQEAVAELLAGVGLTPWPTRRVRTMGEALEAATAFDWPVALKIADERIRGRLDVGAVRLGITSPVALDRAWHAIRAAVGPGDMLVQPMAPRGVSTVVRLRHDPAIGPLLSLRLGGVAANLLADPLVRTLPLTDRDAADMVRSIRGSELLTGAPGVPPADTDALEDVLHRLAKLGEEVPAVAEVVLDPVLVGQRGVVLLHAAARLLPPETNPDSLPRRMTGDGVDYFQ